MLIDTHCHLDYLQKDSNLHDIIENAKINSVLKMVTISTLTSKFEDEILPITQNFENIFCTIGTHPDNAGSDIFNVEFASQMCEKYSKIIGIGETGIDLHHIDNPPLSVQVESLEKHIYIAKKYSIPLIFHSRASESESCQKLKQMQDGNLKCIMHCFTGSAEFAKQCLDMGCYISISGISTFKNAEKLRDVVKIIPIDRLLIETDSPFLAPIPHRGSQNKPEYLKYTAIFLANFLNLDYEQFTHKLWQNSHTIFDKING